MDQSRHLGALRSLDRFRARPYLRCAFGTHLYRVL